MNVEAAMTTERASRRAEAEAAERTCVGCREVAPRQELLRFAISVEDGVAVIVPDVAHKLGGRGASTHARKACIEQGIKRGGFAKAASARVDVDPAALLTMVEAQLIQRAKGLLLGAIRSKSAILGADSTEKAIAHRGVVALVLASDAATRTGGLAASIGRLGGRAIELMTKAELGGLVGREEVAVIGIGDEGIAAALSQVAQQVAGVRGVDDKGETSPSKVG